MKKHPIYISVCLLLCLGACVRNNPYDPEYRDNYQQLRYLTGVPHKRTQCGFALVNNTLYVVGGKLFGLAVTDSIETYDTQTAAWDSILPPPMQTRRYDCKTAVVNNKLYVFGGRDAANQILTSVEEYDPDLGSWTGKASLPAMVIDFEVMVTDGKVYVIGGRDAGSVAQSRVDMYDPLQNTWTSRAPLANARYNLGVAELGGNLYAAGGQLDNTTKYKIVEIYDPAANQWSTGDTTNLYHTDFTMAATNGLDNSYLHIIDMNTMPDFEEFDTAGGAWQVRTLVEPVSIAGLSQTANHNGRVYFTDGTNVYWFLP